MRNEKISIKYYNEIQKDLEEIENQLQEVNGSESLWKKLTTKYELIFPDLIYALNKRESKMSSFNRELDFRPELNNIKTALLTKILVCGVDGDIDQDIGNETKILLEENQNLITDKKFNELVVESKIYIRKKNQKDKQIALDKIWDAFERFKTYYSNDKVNSVGKILNEVSKGSNEIYELLNEESNKLTKIGNKYQIRHFETDKIEINSVEMKEYLYFRMLSFISLCIKSI